MVRFVVLFALAATLIVGEPPSSCNPPTTDLVVVQKMANPIITITPSDIKVTPYPPEADQIITLSLSINNTGPEVPAYDLVLSDIGFYGDLLFKCGWHTIIRGPLKFDGCKAFKGCPIEPGPKTDSNQIDLKPFAAIISAIGGDKYFNLTMAFEKTDGTKLQEVQVGIYLKKDK